MAVLQPYDTSAGGPSQSAAVDQQAYTNSISDINNAADAANQRTRLKGQFTSVTAPDLQSSLGATGQLYGTAGSNARVQAQSQYTNQMQDLTTAMDRAHMDLTRQSAFAAMGLVL
jgi:hypothetical protein